MKYLALLSAVSAMAALGACGSSGGNNDDESGFDIAAGDALAARAAVITQANPEDLPANATMSGFMVLDLSDDFGYTTSVVGDMNMSADFEAARITGGASNLFQADIDNECSIPSECDIDFQQNLGGSLTIASSDGNFGTISGSTFNGFLDGEITGNLDDDEFGNGTFVADVVTDFEGVFGVDNQGVVASADIVGDVFITPTFGGTEGDVDTQSVDGVFVVGE